MYQDNYQYIQWLQNCIQTQEQRIGRLEQLVQQLSNEIKQLKEKPPIQVGTIEYKFDQLKVETVEGTLNIGLNPADLQGIEDFAINNSSINNPVSPKTDMQRAMEIEEAMLQYMEIELPAIITDTQKQLNIEQNEAYLSFIKEDIKKQLPNRIDFHLKAEAPNEPLQENRSAANEQIIHLLKQEIHNGVLVFFEHLPENVKGMKQE